MPKVTEEDFQEWVRNPCTVELQKELRAWQQTATGVLRYQSMNAEPEARVKLAVAGAQLDISSKLLVTHFDRMFTALPEEGQEEEAN